MDAGNLPPPVAHAFALFTRKSALKGHKQPLFTADSTGETLEITRDDGKLRLCWLLDSHTVTLEVSHGPPTGSAVGWFDLFRATLDGSALRPDQSDFSLDEAVDHGLELMFPNSQVE